MTPERIESLGEVKTSTAVLQRIRLPQPATTPPASPKPATWKEAPWARPEEFEPDELLTRDELLARLRDWGHQITERRLRNWEAAGVTPRPVLRKHEGLTQNVYPGWAAEMIAHAVALREGGTKLDDISHALRQIAASHREMQERVAELNLTVRMAEYAIQKIALLLESAYGINVTTAQLRMNYATGETWEHRLNLDSIPDYYEQDND